MPESERSSIRRLTWAHLSSHLGLIISGTIAAFAIFQVMALSNWNAETAQAIIQEQGTVQIVTGTLFELLRTVTPVALFAVVSLPLTRCLFPELKIDMFQAVSAASMGAVLGAFVVPLSGLLILVFMGICILAAYALGERARARKSRSEEFPAEGSAEGASSDEASSDEAPAGKAPSEVDLIVKLYVRRLALPAVVVTAIFLLGNDPWLPRENLVFENSRVEVGYVLNSDSDQTVYLDALHHEVHRIRSADLSARGICEWLASNGSVWDKSLGQLLFGDPGYPACHRDDQ